MTFLVQQQFENNFQSTHNIQSQKNKNQNEQKKNNNQGQPLTANEKIPFIPCDLVNGRWVDVASTTPTVSI